MTVLGRHALAWIAGIAIGSVATAAPRQLAREVARPLAAQAITAAAEREAAVATAAIDKNPLDVAARVRLARALLALERVDAAEGQLQEALRLAPGDEDVLYYLGLVTGHQARRTFERLFAIAPDSARVHQLMAESLEAREQRAEAEQEYASALRVNPSLVDAMLGLARLQRIRLACDDAMTLYERAERLRPTFEGAYGLGSCQLQQRQFAAAAASLEQAVARDGTAAHAWVALASARLGAGKAADAVVAVERALAVEPTMGEAYYVLGRVHQATGETARARAAFERARQLRVGEHQPLEPR